MSSSRMRLALFLVLALSSLGLGACGIVGRDSCAAGLSEYQGTCLDKVSQNFVSCTATRGQNLSTEDKTKLGASVDVGLKGVGGVVEISKKVVETELPEVALEIVRICLELSKSLATPVEQTQIQTQIQTLQKMLDESSKGTIALNPTSGPYGQTIVVTGTDWPANIEVEVTAFPAKVRTITTAEGTFRTTIKLDPTLEPVAFSPVTISVSPVKASTQRAATALYEIVK